MIRLGQDLKYAIRLLLKTPVITCVAVLSLALGIGANTATFGVMNAVMLRSLPVRNPQQLVSIEAGDLRYPGNGGPVSLAMFRAIRKHATVFSSVFVWLGSGIANIRANGVTYPGQADEVSGDYFSALGVHPVLGRVLTSEDVPLEGHPSARVAVISYDCWQNRYGGDPHVLGKTIRVENIPFTIVGVSPQRFTGMAVDSSPEATVPIDSTAPELTNRSALRWFAYGRLKPGVSIARARAQCKRCGRAF